jgi:tRNA-2-methylthio-N6-dimethylallyladenosine synthase
MSTVSEAPTVIETSAASRGADGRARTYEVRTFGCQMNVHDSERLSGSLEAAGYVKAEGVEADVVVINTCAVRENADNKLYGNLGHLASVKRRHEGMQIAVGGCLAQKDKSVILDKAPWVDVVFGTHNMGALPSLLERARHNDAAEIEILESLETFPSTLPTKRDSTYSGWVSISVGCNNTCTFCIVPALRGKEKDRRPGEVLAEIQSLVDDGAIEVTLLGQNVNSYGVEFGDRLAFGKLLRAAGTIPGLERIRFTSPHPAAFTDDVIDAMAETPNVMPQLHMPLQSGSDRILRAMKRSYRSAKFLGILDRVREKIPNAAISTDIIVGFPGETEEDFLETMRVVEAARFASAFTFQYSIRPGTPAATLPDQVPHEVVQERYERLVALQERISLEENRALIGRRVNILVANGEGRKDQATNRLSGRAEDSRLVHFEVPAGSSRPRPGDVVSVTITQAAPFHLIADTDGATLEVRRTRAGDAWDRAEAESCGLPSTSAGASGAEGTRAVSLGLPTLRVGVPAVSVNHSTPAPGASDSHRDAAVLSGSADSLRDAAVLSEGAHSHRDASVSTGAAAGHGVATVPIYSPTDDLRG